MGVYRAEYIWIDGTQPTQKLRSKTKIVPDGEKPPIWGFDGSSTQQATGDKSDCVLQPVFVCPTRSVAATTSSFSVRSCWSTASHTRPTCAARTPTWRSGSRDSTT